MPPDVAQQGPQHPLPPCKESKPEPTQTSIPDCEFIRNVGDGITSQRTPGCSNEPNPEHGNPARNFTGFLKQKGENKEKAGRPEDTQEINPTDAADGPCLDSDSNLSETKRCV